MSRTQVKRLLESLSDSHPRLVDELIPKLLSLGEVQRILQQLLKERVSIRDLGTILEVLVDQAGVNKQLVSCVEQVRHKLAAQITHSLTRADGKLHVYLLEPSLETAIQAVFISDNEPQSTSTNVLSSSPLKHLLESLKKLTSEQSDVAFPVLVCQSPARYFVQRWLAASIPRIATISPTEISDGVAIECIQTIS